MVLLSITPFYLRDGRFGVTKLCTTLRLPGLLSFSPLFVATCGRYMRTGRCLNAAPWGFSNFWLMGLYSAKSCFFTPFQSCVLSSLLKNMTVFPVPVLACTRTGRVGLRNAAVHEFSCSGEDRQSRFWGVSLRHDYSLHPLLPGAAVIVSFPVSLVIGTASVLHCIKRDDYINSHYVD